MAHYFSEKQDSALRINEITARLRGRDFEFLTASGVFSIKKVDKGTEILVNNCLVEDGWRVLDLGCGYGVVGVVLKKLCPKLDVVMTDVNKRAVKLAKMNAKLNKVEVDVRQGDMYSDVDGKFDTVIVNPPTTAGKDICFAMIEQSKDFLKKGGILQVVARHNVGGKTLMKKMEDVFGNAEHIVIKSGYRVYVSKNG